MTEADAEKIAAARASYEALPEDAKKLVSNLSKLTAAENALKAIRKDAADQAAADEVSELLRSFDPETITADALEDEARRDELERQVADLRWAYDNLTKAQKVKVDPAALARLEDAEGRLASLICDPH